MSSSKLEDQKALGLGLLDSKICSMVDRVVRVKGGSKTHSVISSTSLSSSLETRGRVPKGEAREGKSNKQRVWTLP
jgi:hypothetical protein